MNMKKLSEIFEASLSVAGSTKKKAENVII